MRPGLLVALVCSHSPTFFKNLYKASTVCSTCNRKSQTIMQSSSYAPVCLFTLLSILVVTSPVSSQNSITNCNLRNLDVCLISLSVFAQTPAVVKESDIDRQCIFINETTTCLSRFADDCMTDTQAELIDLVFDGAYQMQDSFCTVNSSLRNLYMKHAPCLSTIGKETKGCFKILQTSMEAITTTKWNNKIPYMCCTYHKLKNCTESVVKEKCGDEPLEFINAMMRVILSRIPDLLCPADEYTPETPICAEIPTTVPKVSKSTSLLNKLLNAYSAF